MKPTKKELINLYHNKLLTLNQIGKKFDVSESAVFHWLRKFKIKSRPTGSRPLTKDRFLKIIMPEPNTGCWLWLGSLNKKGYGNKTVYDKTRSAHRLSYELFKGKIPKRMCVCHLCDTPSCVNPDHLWLGTLKDNVRDMIKKGRHYHGERVSWSKLTNEDIINIKAIYSNGIASKTIIGLTYGVNATHISKIVNGKIWKHL